MSGMLAEAFEPSISAIMQKALGERLSPCGVAPMQSSPVDVVPQPVPLSCKFRQTVAPSSGLAKLEMIDGSVPGKETCKYV